MEGTSRHFICSIGTADYQPTDYARPGAAVVRSRFAPVAIARSVKLSGARATVLVTAASARYYGDVAEELRAAGLEPAQLDIPDGRSESEFLTVFDRLSGCIRPGECVSLDITLGLRHLPFIYVATLVYLTALQGVTVEGVYYGALEPPIGDRHTVPTALIIEVSTLMHLVRWATALSGVRETGDFSALARLIRSEVGRLFQVSMPSGDNAGMRTSLSHTKSAVEALASSAGTGLPIEAGSDAARALRAVRGLKDQLGAGAGLATVATSAALTLEPLLSRWALPEPLGKTGKFGLPLTEAELDRQLNFATWQVAHQRGHTAIILLREWLVSLMLYREGGDSWLNVERRRGAEAALTALTYRAKKEVALRPAEAALAAVWGRVANPRNLLAHAGMRPEWGDAEQSTVLDLLQSCRTLLMGAQPGEPPTDTSGARVLVAGLGLSPGALFTALRLIRPDRSIVITSDLARGTLEETLRRAQQANLPAECVIMAEPFVGFAEAADIVTRVRPILAEAGEVVANLSGGSTVIQYVVDCIAIEAIRLNVHTRRVAAVDRRGMEKQRAEPYVLGEIVDIEDTGLRRDD